jgi:hypothetical protein
MRDRAVDERAVCEVGADDSGFRLEEHAPAVGSPDRPAPTHRLRGEQLIWRTRSVERGTRSLGRIVDELEQAVQLEQLDARVALELAPARKRLLRELDELHLGIGEAHDPRAPVTRAARVADLELLIEDDVVPVAGERVRGGRAHDPRSDDCDLGSHVAILARR